MVQESDYKTNIDSILEKLNILEQRMTVVENRLSSTPAKFNSDFIVETNEEKILSEEQAAEKSFGFESRIGGYGLALMGNIVLFFGIIFLSQYIQNNGYPFLSGVFGFLSAAVIFLLAHFTQKTISHLAFLFNLTAHILLYYVTLRLHYFSNSPLIESSFISILLISIVIGTQLFISFKNKLQIYAVVSFLLILITGYISKHTVVTLGGAAIVTAATVILFFLYNWRFLVIQSLLMIYLTFLVWFMMNPLTPIAPSLPAFHEYCHFYLFFCAGIFSLIALIPPKEKINNSFIVISLLINGLLFTGLLAMFVSSFFLNNYNMLFVVISIFCMIYSVILKRFSLWKFSPAFYAMYGFVAISISVFGLFKPPYIFMLLALQGLFVAIIALWFRSRLLVTMNAILMFLLLLTYIVNFKSVDSINFIFAGVALITAWILNKKKKLLELDSNILPNIYSMMTFFLILFSLFKFVPTQYVTLSWTMTAIAYFILSMLLKNGTYRWMAILTMLATMLYLFIVDLSQTLMVYRIIAFLFLAIISIIISIFYSRIKKSNLTEQKNESNIKI